MNTFTFTMDNLRWKEIPNSMFGLKIGYVEIFNMPTEQLCFSNTRFIHRPLNMVDFICCAVQYNQNWEPNANKAQAQFRPWIY